MDLLEPNVHPILVHFAFALGITSAAVYLATSLSSDSPRSQRLRHAADWMLAITAVSVIASVAAGFQAYYTVAHDGPSHAAMTTHRNWALLTGVSVIALATWRWRTRVGPPSRPFVAGAAVCAVLLGITGWWGGALVYQFGLGVQRLPVVSVEGHDHDHGEHDHAAADGAIDSQQVRQAPAIKDSPDAQPMSLDVDVSDPNAVAEAFSRALDAGQADRLRALSRPALIVTESGRSERSFDEYANHHMPADFAFSQAVDRQLIRRDVVAGETVHTVVSESQIHGRNKDKAVHEQLTETLVLERIDGQWRVAHVHWSSSPIVGEHTH
ncbi:MAG: DUF2231 domain-containing protein [Pseudomonadota bacterium]